MYPSVSGLPAAASTFVIRPSVTVTVSEQASGQSSGHAVTCSVAVMLGKSGTPGAHRPSAGPGAGTAERGSGPSGRCGAVGGDLVERRVLGAGVHPVLELDHAEPGEPLAQPTVGGVEPSELLAVRH